VVSEFKFTVLSIIYIGKKFSDLSKVEGMPRGTQMVKEADGSRESLSSTPESDIHDNELDDRLVKFNLCRLNGKYSAWCPCTCPCI